MTSLWCVFLVPIWKYNKYVGLFSFTTVRFFMSYNEHRAYLRCFVTSLALSVITIFQFLHVTWFKPLAHGRYGGNIKTIIFKLIIQTICLNNRCKIDRGWMPQSLSNDKSTLLHVIDSDLCRHILLLSRSELNRSVTAHDIYCIKKGNHHRYAVCRLFGVLIRTMGHNAELLSVANND